MVSGEFREADMTDFELDRQYDAVLCLFSSIRYVRTLENVGHTLTNFRRHTAPDGVIVVEPWFTPDAVESERVYLKTAESDALTVCRMSHMQVEGRLSRLRFEYLIGRPDGIERAKCTSWGCSPSRKCWGASAPQGLQRSTIPKVCTDAGCM